MTTRNSNAHFDLAPQMTGERSTFDRSCNIHTSFNVGDLVPFYIDEILPGDSYQIETSKVARLQTLIAPVMDNLYLDTYYFFVPNRLVWENWKYFCGESQDDWIDPEGFIIPTVRMPQTGYEQGTVADYMGIPTYVTSSIADKPIFINWLPFRAYGLIWNEWFRDENLQDPVLIYKNQDATANGLNSYSTLGGKVLKANKYHDYFTSCLPAPQKGEDVSFMRGMIPVRSFAQDLVTGTGLTPMAFRSTVSGNRPAGAHGFYTSDGETKIYNDSSATTSLTGVYPSNLYADLSTPYKYTGGQLSLDTSLTINSLRRAFQIQRMLERDARGGTRYIEILKAHFGITSPDARLQRPEYLGGNRVPLNIEQVINTTGNVTMQLHPGDTSGWSQTSDVHYDVEKSFVEHGYIIGLMCVRYDHTYQQGLERMWSRSTRYDFYWPALAHLGEQAVYKKEIFLDDQMQNEVFGYQEAWAEYRYKPNYVTGAMRSNLENSLDIWHFADYYEDEEGPFLSEDWIKEDKNNVDRSLLVTSEVENQIFMDIYVKNKCTRPMPLYSIPGLIDHF